MTVPVVLWLMATSFIVGHYIATRSTTYKIGLKIRRGIHTILEKRKFVGDKDMTVTVTTEWNTNGHDMRLILEHDPKEDKP